MVNINIDNHPTVDQIVALFEKKATNFLLVLTVDHELQFIVQIGEKDTYLFEQYREAFITVKDWVEFMIDESDDYALITWEEAKQ